MESPAYNFPPLCEDCGKDMFEIDGAWYCTNIDCENLHRRFDTPTGQENKQRPATSKKERETVEQREGNG
jgi:uncharacterized Zn finger protein (UPF0148 family)